MPDRPHNHAKDASNTSHNGDKNIENKAGEKSALDPKVAEKSQADAKGMAAIESQRTNKHDGSAGGHDSAESVTIEALDSDGNKRKVSRLDGGTEKDLRDLKDLEFNRDRPTPLGGFKEVHRPDGGITLSGVIPGTDTELENITTDTMRALAPENKLVDSALTMRQQIEQHMQPGPDRDRAINQLKSDVTASLFGVSIDSGGAEDAGVHKALTPEVTPISVFDKISKLPLDKQAQVIGAGIEAFQAELGKQGSEIWLGTQKGVNKSVMGMVDDVVGLGQTVGKIWQFGQDVMTNNPRALETSAQAGEAIGGAMVTGVKLWGVTEKYLGEVGVTGDYGKPLRDLSVLGAEINRRWQSLPPGEKAEVASELLTNIAVPGAMAKIGKSARIVERLEDLTDTLKKLKPEDKQAFCQKFGEFLDRLFPGPRHGELRPAYATAGEGGRITDEIKDETILFSHQHDSGKVPDKDISKRPGFGEETYLSLDSLIKNKRFSPDVVVQHHENACVSACGEMLTNGRLKQESLHAELMQYFHPEMRKPDSTVDLKWLARELKADDPEWSFRFADPDDLNQINRLNSAGTPWAAEIRAYGKSGHAVVVKGLNDAGDMIILDPKGFSYEISVKDFARNCWSGRFVEKQIQVKG
ncbi:hypothetical protein GC174_10235 [bacterium]|nr:hypothetical protein [bacterium]